MENKKDFKPIILYFGFNIVLAIFLGIILAILRMDIVNNLNLWTIILNAILFGILAIIYRKKIINDFKKFDKKMLIRTLLFSVVILAINYVLSILLESQNASMENQETIEEMFLSMKIPMSLYIALIAPFNEELTFRYSLETLFKKKEVFIIVSGLFFGLMHSTGIDFILYASLGALLGYAYIKNDKNIISTIMIHMINNGVSLLLMILFA